MKYWLLTTEYPPQHGGGISTYCFHTARMLSTLGIQVTVFIPDDNVKDYIIVGTESWTTVRFNSNRSNKAGQLHYSARISYEFAQIVQQLIRQEGKPAVIEAQDYHGIAYHLLLFKYCLYSDLTAIPVIITIHSPAFLYLTYNREPVYRFPEFHTCEMEKAAIKMANWLIAPSRFILDATQQFVDLPMQRSSLLRNPYYSTYTLPGGVPGANLIYYGKLSPQKGSFELLACFKQLWDTGFTMPLHIVGGTDIVYYPEQQTMGQLVNREFSHYINRGLLVLHGKIKPTAIEQALKNGRIIIVPSIVDNLPYVVIEAMLLGKVVLASVQGGQREMIDHGINGFLFDHQIPGDLEEKLRTILALPDNRLQVIGEAAREKATQDYSPLQIGADKIRLLSAITAASTPASRFPFLHQEPFKSVKRTGGRLSVIIPYHQKDLAPDTCIQSIRASTYQYIEILLIPYGKDKVLSKGISQFHSQGVKVLNSPYEGLTATLSFGQENATGDFLVFLETCNSVLPEFFARAIQVLKHYDNIFFAGSYVQTSGKTHQLHFTQTPQPPYALYYQPARHNGLVYRRAALQETGPFDQMVGEDFDHFEKMIHLLACGYNGIILPQFFLTQTISSSRKRNRPNRNKWPYAFKYITEKHAAYYNRFATRLANLMVVNGTFQLPGVACGDPEPGIPLDSETYPLIKRLKSWTTRAATRYKTYFTK
ncbi:MAG: glycosyltransferase [Candidatus Pseudobacter hemicellulosilyticus]|uniref:Glycosyltransferase n=1 Tax=Candidatus Pseudobacter hemicellulosilyticus TaxID=3121375 RepID=A0AAJ5WXU9_9BACT|nr:MAG: glycosyltransferase [Pseudobacter sp.]